MFRGKTPDGPANCSVQGNRLQDLVAQLQGMLRPPVPPVSGASLPAVEAAALVRRSEGSGSLLSPAVAAAASGRKQCNVGEALRQIAQSMARTCASLGVELVVPSVTGLDQERMHSGAAASTSGGGVRNSQQEASMHESGTATALLGGRAADRVVAPAAAGMHRPDSRLVLLPRPSRPAPETLPPPGQEELLAPITEEVLAAHGPLTKSFPVSTVAPGLVHDMLCVVVPIRVGLWHRRCMSCWAACWTRLSRGRRAAARYACMQAQRLMGA